MHSLAFGLLVVILSLVSCAPALFAQVTTASILGTVTDSSGGVVPSVTVTATNIQTNFARSAATNEAGQYQIAFLPTGTYRVEINSQGFKRFLHEGIVLETNRNARVDAVLEVGAVTESVSVSADASLVNTVNATIGRTVDNNEINNLPLVNRDVYSLLLLTPGVESSTSSNVFGYPEQSTIINGSPNQGVGSVNYFLDGGHNTMGLRYTGNVAPNPDAVQEFRVITNSYGAEFGRFAGGVIDVTTRSGTNSLHGSVFEFFRNDKLNANSWNILRKPPLRRNQFGGSLGGPIRKDRTFYFGSYSGLRQRLEQIRNTAIVPTSLERVGNFSASRVKPVDPVTRQPYENGIIPTSLLDPTAQRIIKEYIPLANLPGNFFEVTQAEPTDTDEVQFKIDHSLSPSHQLAGSYYLTDGKLLESLAGNIVWSRRRFDWRQQNLNVSDTWTISPTAIHQLRGTYVRNFGGRLNTPEISLAALGSSYAIQGPPSLPNISVSGFFTLGQGIAGPSAGSNYYGLRDTLSLTRGKHSVKIGADVSLEKMIHDTTLDNYGRFGFDGTISGSGLTDFVLGKPRDLNQDTPITKIDNAWYFGFYIQDDWRILPRLTLNIGLRYDLQLPFTDPHDRKLTFVPGVQSRVVPKALLGLVFPGDPGITRGIVEADKNNFAPRVGLAWDPFGNSKTSVRAAFGVFYGGISGNQWNGTADNQPFTMAQDIFTLRSLTDPYGDLPGGVSPIPSSYAFTRENPVFVLPAQVAGIALGYRWPYTYQMNFSVQRQLRGDLSVEAGYVSNLSHKRRLGRDVNYPIFGPGATAGNVNSRRPYLPGIFANINQTYSALNTAYHGFQTTVEKRMSRNVQFKGYYTFSKSLDGSDTSGSGSGGAQNQNNFRPERGRTNNDRLHNMVASVVWQTHYFNNQRVARLLLDDWTLSGIITLRSGMPFTVTSGTDRNLDGSNNDRANLIGNPHLDPNRSRSDVTAMWFDKAAFVPAPIGQEGTSGRNILDGPGMKTVDLGIFRDFALHERLRLQFRAELTNAFNLVSLNLPTSALNSAAVGTIRNARPMREVQLGLRLAF